MGVSSGYGKTSSNGLVFSYDITDTKNCFLGEPTTNYIWFNNPRIDESYTPFVPYSDQGAMLVNHPGGIRVYNQEGSDLSYYVNAYDDWTNYHHAYWVYDEQLKKPVVRMNDVVGTWQAKYMNLSSTMNAWSTYGYDTGTKYTISWLQWVSHLTKRINVGMYTPNASNQWSFWDDLSNGSVTSTNTKTNTWERVYHTFTVSGNWDLTKTGYGVYFYGMNFINGAEVRVADVQFEMKDHPTQFCDRIARGTEQSLFSLNKNTPISVSGVTFDANAQVVFDGTNDMLTIPSNTDLEIVDNITVEVVYMRLTTDPDIDVIINKYYGTGWELMVSVDNRVVFAGRNGDGTYYTTASATKKIENNKYYHIVGIKSGLLWKVYVNGDLWSELTAGSVGYLNNTAKLQINGEGSSYFSNMKLPMVKIYNRVLSDNEIKRNFNSLRFKFIKNGLTPSSAVSSISELRSVGITTDGPYWFSTSKQSTPFKAYVRFNYIDGQDWVLLLKVHHQDDIPSGSAYWTNNTTYNNNDFALRSGHWAKYDTWNGIPFTRLMMVMTQDNIEKVPPIMIFNTSRTFAEAITLAGGSSASSNQNNIVKCDSTDPPMSTNATYYNVTMKSGTNFNNTGVGMEPYMQAYGISMWGNNSTNSTTAEGLSSTGRAGAWIGCPLDEGSHTFNSDSNYGSDSGFGFGASGGNVPKTTSAGYNEWTMNNSVNTLPGYVWVR